MTAEPKLSKHAWALLRQLTDDSDPDDENVAMGRDPARARGQGRRRHHRRLLRRARQHAALHRPGHRGAPRPRVQPGRLAPHGRGDRPPRRRCIVVVEWLHVDGHTTDGSPLLDDLLPGREPPQAG